LNDLDIRDLIGRKVSHEIEGIDEFYIEYGVIVNAWYDDFLDTIDCYVAFYDPDKTFCEKKHRPNILRYVLSSLELIE